MSVIARIALALFVLLWLFGPAFLRDYVPIWLPFLVAVGLEALFFLEAVREPRGGAERRDAGPQAADRERFGYGGESDELLLVRRGGEELWIPYSGESPEEIEELVAQAREQPAPEPYVVEHDAARPLRKLLTAVATIALVGALAWIVDSRRGWNGLDSDERAAAETRFSREASRIAGHRVTIDCDESGEHVGAVQHADGVAIVGGTIAYLTPERCYELYRVAFEHDFSFAPAGRGIAVLAHEAWHLQGVRDEGRTQCYALQSGVELAQRFGISEGTARRMMRQQLAENAVRGRTRPEYLVPDECRDGGSLDLHPRTSEFP